MGGANTGRVLPEGQVGKEGQGQAQDHQGGGNIGCMLSEVRGGAKRKVAGGAGGPWQRVVARTMKFRRS